MNEIQDEYREYKKLCRVEDDPGVAGLAQLGRNAIERVTELERMLAERDADIVKLGTALISAERERDAIKGDYDEAAHFARHFIRDDAEVTPRAAIIRLGDKCTSLFARMKIAETERDEWIACHAQLYRKLGSLLAVIHRDGGHYESEHGTEKACADAELAVHVQRGIADGYQDALKIWRQRAEQAEARLAAIDAARQVSRSNDGGLEMALSQATAMIERLNRERSQIKHGLQGLVNYLGEAERNNATAQPRAAAVTALRHAFNSAGTILKAMYESEMRSAQ